MGGRQSGPQGSHGLEADAPGRRPGTTAWSGASPPPPRPPPQAGPSHALHTHCDPPGKRVQSAAASSPQKKGADSLLLPALSLPPSRAVGAESLGLTPAQPCSGHQPPLSGQDRRAPEGPHGRFDSAGRPVPVAATQLSLSLKAATVLRKGVWLCANKTLSTHGGAGQL